MSSLGKRDSTSLNFSIGKFKNSTSRVPEYSRLHPVIPKLYVQEWKTDMQNRNLIKMNAGLGWIPAFEHDENLFLEKREQLHYNVEDANRVDGKYTLPDRVRLLHPALYHETSRYQSGLMCRWDKNAV